jgi:hypothetical protein
VTPEDHATEIAKHLTALLGAVRCAEASYEVSIRPKEAGYDLGMLPPQIDLWWRNGWAVSVRPLASVAAVADAGSARPR